MGSDCTFALVGLCSGGKFGLDSYYNDERM